MNTINAEILHYFNLWFFSFHTALGENKVSRLYLIPSLMRNMLEVMKQTNEMLPRLLQWESTGEALTFDTAEAFFQTFANSNVRITIYLKKCLLT